MALKATIFKAELIISDLERHYYQTHHLTLARHPSETDERMMLRILIFAIYADERLEMTRGLSTDDEPDVWKKSLTNEIEHWIELGQPDERRLRKASGRANRVSLLTYGGNAPEVWWEQNGQKLKLIDNLDVWRIEDQYSKALANLTKRNMRLQVMIDDAQIWFTADEQTVEITLSRYQ